MIVIGEKINGSIPSCGQAIARRDGDWIRGLARAQSDAGAAYLDCCASVNEGELETMHWLIGLIQDETDARVCVDSPDPAVCVKAMDFCKKAGIVNSVSLEGNKIDVVFPAIAGTQWGCVALLSGDDGIPRSAADRLRNFDKLTARAAQYGIGPERLYIDPLVEGVGTNQQSLLTFAETAREIKRLCPGIHVTSGLSNISFGLPVRKALNSSFLCLAMQAGMDSAILDPTNRDLMGLMYATEALLGNDDYCLEYIGAYREGLFGPVK